MGNDYRFITDRLADLQPGWATLRASVFVPVFNRREVLRKTLAGLALQDYPHELFEVVIADDGSNDKPEALQVEYASRLSLRFVRQEHCGFRLAAVRNLAVAAASGPVVVSLDCDMLPPPGFLSAYMRWFHVYDGPLMVIGGRRYVDTKGVSAGQILADFGVVERLPYVPAPPTGRLAFAPTVDWREPEIRKSHAMRDHAVPYALASGGNVAYWKRDGVAAGGYCEAFEQWGGEDEEFAYRMYRRGAYFIPEAGATAYHQDHSVPGDREQDRSRSRALLASRVPHYRSYAPQAPREAPKVSIYIPAFNAERWICEAVDSALAQTVTDLEVCVCDDGSTDRTTEVLAECYHLEPRVRWFTQPNGGTPAAARAAIECCRGEFLLGLDADDRLAPNAASVLLKCLESDPRSSLAYGGYRLVDATGRLLRVVPAHPYDRAQHLTVNLVSPPRMMRSRDYYRAGGYDCRVPYAEDFDLFLKVSEQGLVRHTHKILYDYRWYSENKSQSCRAEVVRDHQKVVEAALQRRGLRGRVVCRDRAGRIQVDLELDRDPSLGLLGVLEQRWQLWSPPQPRALVRRGARKLLGRIFGR